MSEPELIILSDSEDDGDDIRTIILSSDEEMDDDVIVIDSDDDQENGNSVSHFSLFFIGPRAADERYEGRKYSSPMRGSMFKHPIGKLNFFHRPLHHKRLRYIFESFYI
jgi:hypothetical protein